MSERFFTKTNDVVKGPYETSSIQKSLDDERISPNTLVRGEDETDFVPVAEHPTFERIAKKKKEIAAAQSPNRGAYDDGGHVERGSFGLGFLAGMCGIVGLLLVRAMAKGEETKKGATVGFIVCVVVVLVIRLAAMK
jgi:hypothetical protein